MATMETLTPTPVLMTPAHLMAPKLEVIEGNKPKTRAKPLLAQSDFSSFNPSRHLRFSPPPKVHTMRELGYPDSRGISPIGVSEPFPLFTEEAVKQMRAEVLSDEVWTHYQYSSNLAKCQLRGYAAEQAAFVYDAWRSPEMLAIISKIAGIDLVPAMDWEIGHINISIPSDKEKAEAPAIIINESSEEPVDSSWEDENPIVDWHTDSYPFVCVTMLSDCTNMIGGETALRKGNGEVLKVRGPQMGSAVVLQGRYIEHRALQALGMAERISMVTSFRPRSSHIKDDTVLTTVRGISNLGELYFQFSEYRFEMLQDRLRDMNRVMRERKRARRRFDTKGIKDFIAEQIEFLTHMNREIVEDDKVKKGFLDDSHLISEDLRQRSRKRVCGRSE